MSEEQEPDFQRPLHPIQFEHGGNVMFDPGIGLRLHLALEMLKVLVAKPENAGTERDVLVRIAFEYADLLLESE
jgi:hypothetical protein